MEIKRSKNNWAEALGLPKDNYTNTVIYEEIRGVGLMKFRPFCNFDFIVHGFSTRIGGTSSGEFASMNLSFTRGDDKSNVLENYRRIAEALNTDIGDMVSTNQTHTVNVCEADESHKGIGIEREQSFQDVDGFVTGTKNLCLVTSYADCVPLYFADTKNKVIGLSHSGWRGTAGNICRNTVELMGKLYNSMPKDIVTFIGPSICASCYEVSGDLLEPFGKNYTKDEMKLIFEPHGQEKFMLNLWCANVLNMQKAGIPSENIFVTDVCTCCNSSLLFSHRASHGRRGGLCGFLKLL